MNRRDPLLSAFDDEESNEDTLLDNNSEYSFGNSSGSFRIEVKAIPFTKLLDQLKPYDASISKVLVPGCKILVSVRDVTYMDDVWWYTIVLEHSHFVWTLKKRRKDIIHFHHKLQMQRAFLKLQLPEIKLEKDPTNRRLSSLVVNRKKVPRLPHLPAAANDASPYSNAPWHRSEVENYLKKVLRISQFRKARETMDFLEISPMSFIDELGKKQREGYVYRTIHIPDSLLCVCPCRCWMKKRWLFVKESFVSLMDIHRGLIEQVLLIDREFKVDVGKPHTRHSDGIVIRNLSKNLYLRCYDQTRAELWAAEFRNMITSGPTEFIMPNPHGSFAPIRTLTECKWIVDGATYFEAVAEALERATQEIFIADWWLSPEIYMKRPTVHGHHWQLDYILRRKARAGVRIYILLYKEVEMALGLDSAHSKDKLIRMHKNIKVLRHPKMSKGVLFWAHHEKVVCVDQTYAFVGGLDLCYGRWDDYQHRLSDFGDFEDNLKIRRHLSTFATEEQVVSEAKSSSSVPNIGPAVDSSPERREDEMTASPSLTENFRTERSTSSLTRRNSESNLLSLLSEAGTSADDNQTFLLKKALQKYHTYKAFGEIKRQLSLERKDNAGNHDMNQDPLHPADRRRTVQEITLLILGFGRKHRLWHGKDYVNFITKDLQRLNEPYTDMIDRNTTPRMPWHDVGIFVQGKAARDIARHFILRWNHAKIENSLKDSFYPYLVPKTYFDFEDRVPTFLQDTVGTIYRADCQVLRSLTHWSGQLRQTERSIQEAYIDVINESKHFIYIENQFFISLLGRDKPVENGIMQALFNRILLAHGSKTRFHVFVVLPLLPAFEGEIGTGTGTCIQSVMNWNYKSICRSPGSLYQQLSERVQDPSMFISFCGLRTHGSLNNKLVTELVYVHSKVLIADDRVAIIGSANINDRSLRGDRDSEIAVLVKDTQFHKTCVPHKVGKFCFSLRTALFREHLGMMSGSEVDSAIRDPTSKNFIKGVWEKVAINNSSIYEEVFRCLPSDRVRNFQQMKEFQKEACLAVTDPETAREKLKDIRGYLVLFPLYFLSEEKLNPHLSTKEGLLPVSVWT